jgi:hypothetical protein
VYALVPSADVPGNGSYGKVQVQFLDAGLNVLGVHDSLLRVDAASPKDVYVRLTATGTAPANTAYARIVPTFVQLAWGGGSVYFDQARLERVVSSVAVQSVAAAYKYDASHVIAQDDADLFPSVMHVGDTWNGGSGCDGDPLVITRTFRALSASGASDIDLTINVADTEAPQVDASISSINMLLNPGFEAGGPWGSQEIDNWGYWGNIFHEGPAPLSGAFHVKAFGFWTRDPDHSGIFQDAPAAPGQTWRASIHAMVPSSDIPQKGSYGKLRIEFYDMGYGLLSATDGDIVVDATSPKDVYIRLAVTETAPANTAFVRIAPTYMQLDYAGGAVYFDDARLEILNDAITVQCMGDVPVPDTSLVIAQDSGDWFPDVAHVVDSISGGIGSAADPIVITRTFRATDDCGHSADATVTINVADTIAPTLSGGAADAVIEAPAAPVFTTPFASDNCDASPSISASDATTPGACAGSYSVTRTWVATDRVGNNSLPASQTITVQDTTAPVLNNVPANVTVECDAVPAPADVTAVDVAEGNVAVSMSASTAAGGCPGSYTITRTWSASDACGNGSSASQVITVQDTTAPVLAGQGADATIEAPAAPVFTAPTASDGCDASPVVTFSDATVDGASAGTYAVTRTWVATDACGNESAPVSQTINVVDTTAPVITSLGDQVVVQGTGGIVEFSEPVATDSLDGAVTVTCAPASGSQLGAGTHTITATCTDAAGNTSTLTFNVHVLGSVRVVIESPLNDDNVADNIETDQDVQNKFKVGSTVPHKVKLLDEAGNDVTAALASQVTVRLNVTQRQYVNASTSTLVNEVPENYTGVGGAGGLMVLTDGHFQYNLKTTGYPAGTVGNPSFFRAHITVEYDFAPGTVVGEEDALLESK